MRAPFDPRHAIVCSRVCRAGLLALSLGYFYYRNSGASFVGIALVLPAWLMVLGPGWLYVRFGGLGWLQAVFYGAGAGVISIIAMSAGKLTAKNTGRDKIVSQETAI